MRCMSEAANLHACQLYDEFVSVCIYLTSIYSIEIRLSRNFVRSPVIELSLTTLLKDAMTNFPTRMMSSETAFSIDGRQGNLRNIIIHSHLDLLSYDTACQMFNI